MIRSCMKSAKNEWLSSQFKSIYNNLRMGIHRKRAFKMQMLITNLKNRKTTIIKDKNGIPFTDNNSRIERWTEYCKDTYNFKINLDCYKN